MCYCKKTLYSGTAAPSPKSSFWTIPLSFGSFSLLLPVSRFSVLNPLFGNSQCEFCFTDWILIYRLRSIFSGEVQMFSLRCHILLSGAMLTYISRDTMSSKLFQFSSVTQSCPTPCDPMNRSTPGLPVHHQHPEFTQTHVHWVGDAIQPSHPLSSPSLPARKLSQHQSFPMSQLFAWDGQSNGVSASASVLSINTQYWFPLEWTGWISLQSKGLSRVFSNTTVQKHQFFSAQLSSQSNSHSHTWPLEKP